MVRVGDCLKVMAEMEGGSMDSIVTDPPYGLKFMGKEWDRGVPGVPFWSEALRVARPGAYLLAMGGTRTYHRLTCAIEDAGWEIRDCLCWLYGQGFPKGKACLKPAWEPIVMARKRGKVRHLRIDDCRKPTEESLNGGAYSGGKRPTAFFESDLGRKKPTDFVQPIGRWPANVCLDEEAAAMLDEQAGGLKSGRLQTHHKRSGGAARIGTFDIRERTGEPCDFGGDSGGASRFFYVAKASRSEREAGLDGPERSSREWRTGNVHNQHGGRVPDKVARNLHPTVKPIALMRWLCRLVTPPGGTVLDPFAGSGTTGCAAALEGLRFVGIEKEAGYVAIAEARIAHWSKQEMMF